MERVEIRRSQRAQRWRLEVPWGAPVRLTAPLRMTQAQIDQVLAERRPWIEERRRHQVPRLGLEQVSLSLSEARSQARRLVSELADAEAARIGVTYRRIRIGGQRTLWGSCSPNGTLSFNWRLVLAPPAVLDYVVVHEVCHLREANHSARFWALLEEQRPSWREQRHWLREYGSELLAFSPRS